MNSRQTGHRPAAAASPPTEREAADWGFDPLRLWAVVVRRSTLFLPVAGAVFALAVLVILQAVPVFKSTASVLVEPQQKSSLDVQNAPTGQSDNNAVDTQVQLITSQGVAARVVKKLGLQDDPEFRASRTPADTNRLRRFLSNPLSIVERAKPAAAPPPVNPASAEQTVINNALGHLLVRRSGLTYVIEITGSATDPVKAARLANGFAQAYIDQGLDAKLDSSRTASTALGEQLTNLQREVVAGDTAVQDYKIAHNLLSSSGGTMAEQEVSALNQQIAQAQADRAEKEARLAAARAQIAKGGEGQDVGAALGSQTIVRLRGEESASLHELAELNTRYAGLHPLVQKAQNQLREVREQLHQEITRILSSLQAEAEVSRQRVESLQASLGHAHGSLESNNSAQAGLLQLQRKADASRSIYEAFLNRSKETSAQATVQQADARIVTVAQPSTWPASPNLKVALAFGAAFALAAGLVACAIAEFLDNGVETGAEIEDQFQTPYAGSIPSLRSTNPRARGKITPPDFLLDHPFSVFAEAFRSLRAFLIGPTSGGTEPKVIVISSAMPGEGKSLTTFCLARTLAVAGARVVLVDCDLRRRGVSEYAPEGSKDLQHLLRGRTTLEEALVKDPRTDVWFLPARSAPRDGVDLFALPSMTALIDDLKQRFDFVLLDTAPVLAVADTRLLASRADAVLMLLEWRRTPARAVDTALTLLDESHANVVGVGLTQVDLRQQSRYGYGDRNYYYKAMRGYYSD